LPTPAVKKIRIEQLGAENKITFMYVLVNSPNSIKQPKLQFMKTAEAHINAAAKRN
jgi:hypothetical protein